MQDVRLGCRSIRHANGISSSALDRQMKRKREKACRVRLRRDRWLAETSAYGSFLIGTGSHPRWRQNEIPRSKVEEKMGRAGIVALSRGRRPKPECMRSSRINNANGAKGIEPRKNRTDPSLNTFRLVYGGELLPISRPVFINPPRTRTRSGRISTGCRRSVTTTSGSTR